MTSSLKLSVENQQGQLKIESVYADNDGSVDVLHRIHGTLETYKDSIEAVKLDYISRANYFGVEAVYLDHNDTKWHLVGYTKDVSDQTKIENIVKLINDLS